MNEINRDFKGVWIPVELWLSKELKPMEKFFLLEIDSLDNHDGCFASNAHFAELFDISKGRCTQIIKKLEADGWVSLKLIRKDKVIQKRIIKVVNKLNSPIKKIKQGSEKIKLGYLENDEGNNTNINNTNKRKYKEKFVIPDFINQQAWGEFEQHRKEIKKPMSNLARTKATNQLKDLNHEQQQEVVDYSIQGGYPGLYPEQLKKRGANNDTHIGAGKKTRREHHAEISGGIKRDHEQAIARALANGTL